MPAYLMAEVANTCPLEPTQRTTMEATTTMRSGGSRGAWEGCSAGKPAPYPQVRAGGHPQARLGSGSPPPLPALTGD